MQYNLQIQLKINVRNIVKEKGLTEALLQPLP